MKTSKLDIPDFEKKTILNDALKNLNKNITSNR